MKRRIKEQSIIFYSVAKWVFLSVAVGCMVGASTAVFFESAQLVIRCHRFTPLLFSSSAFRVIS